jgi:hypothetical protein
MLNISPERQCFNSAPILGALTGADVGAMRGVLTTVPPASGKTSRLVRAFHKLVRALHKKLQSARAA